MQSIEGEKQGIIRDLGEGLVLRHARLEDTEALAAFNSTMHIEVGAEGPDEGLAIWTRDLMSGNHPTFKTGDFTVVEDTRTGAIVSSVNLISQTWTYDGIEFLVGRPELVATHPDYRRKGLVRAQFEVVHKWSEERGELVQGITGIPWYYRQFGYEMGLNLGGGRTGYKAHVPALKEGEKEQYTLRPASKGDIPAIAQMYRLGTARSLVVAVFNEDYLLYALEGRSKKSAVHREHRIIETPEGEPVGFIAHGHSLWNGILVANVYEVGPGYSWLEVTPSVVRYLDATGEEYARREGKKGFQGFAFSLGAEHPVYEAFYYNLPRVRPPYAWYVRVPDLRGFLQHIRPALEARLARSIAAGHTGKVKVSFYTDGMLLVLEKGKLVGVEEWKVPHADDPDVAFPDLTFLQLLFGYRDLEELKHAYADCLENSNEARAVMMALFPKKASKVLGID